MDEQGRQIQYRNEQHQRNAAAVKTMEEERRLIPPRTSVIIAQAFLKEKTKSKELSVRLKVRSFLPSSFRHHHGIRPRRNSPGIQIPGRSHSAH